MGCCTLIVVVLVDVWCRLGHRSLLIGRFGRMRTGFRFSSRCPAKWAPWDDPYTKRAVKDGMRSRAAYKLVEINDVMKLFNATSTVVDLGAAPGGWTLTTSTYVRTDPETSWNFDEERTRPASKHEVIEPEKSPRKTTAPS